MRDPEKFGKDAVRWLDSHFVKNEYRPGYSDGQRIAGRFLELASQARGELETNLQKISEKRADVKYNFVLYRTALERIIMIVEDARSQMIELRPEFAKAHSTAQLAAYDNRIKFMESRLEELRRDAKWAPRELKGYNPKPVEITGETYVASLAPFKPDMVFSLAETKGPRLAAVSEKRKGPQNSTAKGEEAGFPETVLVKQTDNEMVFAFKKDVPAMELPAPKEEDLRKKIKALNSEIAKAKEESKKIKVRALRMERKRTWLALSEITGEKPPKHVLGV